MILCCGEALIDMIPTRTRAGSDAFAPHTGGAVYNTAIALGRLGRPTGLFTGLSTDLFGRQLKNGLTASHVETGYLSESDRPSTLAFVQLVDGHASYSFFDENSAGRMLNAQDIPAISDEVTALFLGGISLACEPCAETYAELLAQFGDSRAVMMDPNIRPGFIDDPDHYRARLQRMLRQCDILKLSDEDLEWLDPSMRSTDEKVAALFDHGLSVFILTQGGDGATGYLSDGQKVTVPARRVEVVDTVGAGDTFNAGLLAWLSEQNLLQKPSLQQLSPEHLTRALEHGAKVAAITVSRSGANPPWQAEL